MGEPRRHRGLRVAVWVCGVLTALVALWCALAVWLVVASARSPGPGEPGYGDGDPHGFATVGGVLMLLVGLVALLVVGPLWRGLLHRLRGFRPDGS
ncbi:hypothetical protein [Nocardioides sp. 1609]|uniref:hypothetical protein n=1 Tax=Nocardioides sp. 1609 TaxID=2508327 RepID=UPI00106F381B|nr:hypothetical protein [Nocardioides sp. 1609]